MFYSSKGHCYTSQYLVTAIAPSYADHWLTRALYKRKGLRAMATRIIAQAIHLHCSKFLLLENLENASNCYYFFERAGSSRKTSTHQLRRFRNHFKMQT